MHKRISLSNSYPSQNFPPFLPPSHFKILLVWERNWEHIGPHNSLGTNSNRSLIKPLLRSINYKLECPINLFTQNSLSSATQKMAEIQVFKSCTENPISSSSSFRVIDLVKDFEERSSIGQCNHSSDYKDEDEFGDSVVLCVSGSRLVRSGFTKIGCTGSVNFTISC